jgi:hypothetical protein
VDAVAGELARGRTRATTPATARGWAPTRA